MNKGMKEKWVPIFGFENYLVSDQGQVKRKTSGRILKLTSTKDGYYVVGLHENGKKSIRYVHTLVAESFGLRKEGFQLDHINGDKKDNRLSNLRTVTRKQNFHNPSTYYKWCKPVIGTRPDGKQKRFPSMKNAALAIGVNLTQISSCCRGKQKTSKGYTWAYAE